MEKIVLFIISGPLFLSLLLGVQNKSFGKNSFSTIDTVAKKCVDCHNNLLEKQNKHITKTGQGCEDCHMSNGYEHPKANTTGILLKQNLPGLCLSCHAEKKELITGSPFVHEPVNDKKSCTNCHSPHSSDNKKLLLDSRKNLCLSCHNKAITIGTKTTTNIDKLMKTRKVLHPPFEDCEKVCHNPHASQDPRLLNTPFATTNYASPVSSDSFALCWECHGSDMIEKAKSKGATSFRNGETNLHFTHVSGAKGRSCLLCHSPHATNNQHLIRELVPFGKWEYKMNYKSDENGGSCAPGCHTERKYTR